MKSVKSPKVMYSLLGILAVVTVVIAGVTIGTNISDGTDQFRGDEQTIAKQELGTYIESSTTSTEKIGSFGTLKYRVDSVKEEPVPSEGAFSTCKAFYKVYISERSIFGLTRDEGYRFGCLR